MHKEFYIYIISDPRTKSFSKGNYCLNHIPFYVGKAGSYKRVWGRKNPRTMNRINEIKNIGLEPCYIILPSGTEDETYKNEEFFVNLFKRIENGGPLLNKMLGGNRFHRGAGNIPWNKGIPHSEETKRKLSIAAKNRKKNYWLGKNHSEKTKKLISKTHWSKGPNSESIRLKISNTLKGKRNEIHN